MEVKRQPFFSVIIPTFNRADFIKKSIESVLGQDYVDFEILIVDDGSIDNTEEVISCVEDDRIFYFKKKNQERGAARNYGIERSRGRYITFLDSDDLFYKNYLSNAFQSINSLKFPPFFHLGYEIKTDQGKVLTRVNNIPSDDISIFIKGNPLSCLGIFLENSVLQHFRFNEDRAIAGSEDWELWLRVAANYGIKTDNRISAALIEHASRSVLNYKEEDLVRRKRLALESALKDIAVKKKFSPYLSQIYSYMDSYVALHLVLSRKSNASIKYLYSALRNYPKFILDRRFLAIVKYLLINIVRG